MSLRSRAQLWFGTLGERLQEARSPEQSVENLRAVFEAPDGGVYLPETAERWMDSMRREFLCGSALSAVRLMFE